MSLTGAAQQSPNPANIIFKTRNLQIVQNNMIISFHFIILASASIFLPSTTHYLYKFNLIYLLHFCSLY